MRLEERMDSASLADLGTFEPDEMIEDLDQIAESPKVSLRDLYYRWERTNWSVQELDFSQDVADWKRLGDGRHRAAALGDVDVLPRRGVRDRNARAVGRLGPRPRRCSSSLSTQLADEARHTVFFDRFFE